MFLIDIKQYINEKWVSVGMVTKYTEHDGRCFMAEFKNILQHDDKCIHPIPTGNDTMTVINLNLGPVKLIMRR